MKYKTMQEIETRKAAILKEMEQEGADLDALKAEMEELRQNADQIREAAAKAEETRKAIASGAAGITMGETRKAEKASKTVDEIRGSKEYVDAFARYLQSEDDRECRALLSENASSGGQVPVPTLVDPIIKTAWEKNDILNRVNKTSFKGNLKSAFERAADPAYEHGEGTTAITEEDLTLVGEFVVLARGARDGLLPFVLQDAVVLQSREERVERAFHHNHLRLFQFVDDVGDVCWLLADNQKNTVFQVPLPHLRFHIFSIDIHLFLL